MSKLGLDLPDDYFCVAGVGENGVRADGDGDAKRSILENGSFIVPIIRILDSRKYETRHVFSLFVANLSGSEECEFRRFLQGKNSGIDLRGAEPFFIRVTTPMFSGGRCSGFGEAIVGTPRSGSMERSFPLIVLLKELQNTPSDIKGWVHANPPDRIYKTRSAHDPSKRS